MVAHLPVTEKVAGSTPVWLAKFGTRLTVPIVRAKVVNIAAKFVLYSPVV